MECVFCKIYKENKDVIYENKYFFAQFDKFPVSPGHAEIIPKRHVASLFGLSDEEWKYLKSALVDVKEIIEKSDLKKVYEGFLKKSN